MISSLGSKNKLIKRPTADNAPQNIRMPSSFHEDLKNYTTKVSVRFAMIPPNKINVYIEGPYLLPKAWTTGVGRSANIPPIPKKFSSIRIKNKS